MVGIELINNPPEGGAAEGRIGRIGAPGPEAAGNSRPARDSSGWRGQIGGWC